MNQAASNLLCQAQVKNNGEIQYFKNQKNISEDSIVYTSGAGGVFKSGIPIGKIKLDENKDMQINYFTDFSQIRFVKSFNI